MTEGKTQDIFTPSLNRFVVFPILKWRTWNAYKKILNKTWSIESCDTSNVLKEWHLLPNDIKRATLDILESAITYYDTCIRVITQPMIGVIQNAEARCLFGLLLREQLHVQEALSMFHEGADRDFNELRDKPYEGTPLMYGSMSLSTLTRNNWLETHIKNDPTFDIALLAIAMRMFSGSLQVLGDTLSRLNLMTGHAQIIAFIQESNVKFVDALCDESNSTGTQLNPDDMKTIIQSAYDAQIDFCRMNVKNKEMANEMEKVATRDRAFLYGKYRCPMEMSKGGWEEIINNMPKVDLRKSANDRKTDLPEKLARDGERYVEKNTAQQMTFTTNEDF